ncbi:MAG: hypothetical protein K8W52_41955 [Deltaproteobacteria bacterium]|nr:hypothetical protein [Deltaproteobacteria bacterium]
MRSSTKLIAFALVSVASAARAEVSQPTAIIDRPRTLPDGEFEGSISLGTGRVASTTATGTTFSDATGLDLGIGYGFSRRFEGRLGYGIGVDPSTAKGPLGFAIAYNLARGRLSAAFDAGVGYDFRSEHGLPLTLGFEMQGKIGERGALFTPGQQLSIGTSGDNPIGLDLPIGLGYQANFHFWVDVQTKIAHLGLAHDSTLVFGADFIPLQFDAIYAISNAFDLGLGFEDDFKNAGNSYGFTGFARLFL